MQSGIRRWKGRPPEQKTAGPTPRRPRTLERSSMMALRLPRGSRPNARVPCSGHAARRGEGRHRPTYRTARGSREVTRFSRLKADFGLFAAAAPQVGLRAGRIGPAPGISALPAARFARRRPPRLNPPYAFSVADGSIRGLLHRRAPAAWLLTPVACLTIRNTDCENSPTDTPDVGLSERVTDPSSSHIQAESRVAGRSL